jgi:hypothetical protein
MSLPKSSAVNAELVESSLGWTRTRPLIPCHVEQLQQIRKDVSQPPAYLCNTKIMTPQLLNLIGAQE